jgi:hypothetical protein
MNNWSGDTYFVHKIFRHIYHIACLYKLEVLYYTKIKIRVVGTKQKFIVTIHAKLYFIFIFIGKMFLRVVL